MELFQRPFGLRPNKVSYLIPGGEMINGFLGLAKKQEPIASQLWIASVVQSVLEGAPDSRSYLLPEDGGACLKELLETNPIGYLGEDHVRAYGADPAVLVKLLHSTDRLLVQVHPDREKARRYFGSPFGKTEAWYVLDTDGEAFAWAGFVPGVTREGFRALMEAQDAAGVLACLHQFSLQKGDVLMIPAGLPHALGGNSLVAEIQEPTDITLRAERVRPDGSVLPESALHSGIGMEGLLDCFDFTGLSKKEAKGRIFQKGKALGGEGTGAVMEWIGPAQTPYFSMTKIACEGEVLRQNAAFTVGLVTAGQGMLTGNGYGLPIRKGMEFFVPNEVREYIYEGACLELLEFRGPEPG